MAEVGRQPLMIRTAIAAAALAHDGYRLSIEAADDSAGFEVALQRGLPGGMLHCVDLHWRVLNHARLAEALTVVDLDAGAISITSLECGARGLGIVHALLHALLHRITNIPSGQHDRLIWLYDIHLLGLRCTGENWNGFLRQCASLGCRKRLAGQGGSCFRPGNSCVIATALMGPLVSRRRILPAG